MQLQLKVSSEHQACLCGGFRSDCELVSDQPEKNPDAPDAFYKPQSRLKKITV